MIAFEIALLDGTRQAKCMNCAMKYNRALSKMCRLRHVRQSEVHRSRKVIKELICVILLKSFAAVLY